jgi:tol-pal system protein YbgF
MSGFWQKARQMQAKRLAGAGALLVGFVAAPVWAQQNLLEPLSDSSAPAASTTTQPAQTTTVMPVAEDTGQTQQLSQLFYQLQLLQQEVQELRGLVEEQSYQLNRLARDQQEQYIDLDGRIAGMVNSGARPAAGNAATGAATAGSDAAVTTAPGTGGVIALPASGGSQSEREAYTQAFDLMKARQFDESAQAFDALINNYPNGQYTPNAFYWLGELYLAQSASEQARASFAQVLNLYPDHPKVPDSLYKMGVVYHRLGENDEAISYFQRVIREYPNSSAAGLSTRYMAELQ